MTGKTRIGDVEYDLEPLTRSLGFLSRVVQVQVNERIRAGGGLQVGLAAFSALELIAANPGIRQVHAARILLIQESNMANLIKDLLSRGLVERREEDGKRGGLWTTSDGEQVVAAGAWADSIERLSAASISDRDYRQLLNLLNRVYQASLG